MAKKKFQYRKRYVRVATEIHKAWWDENLVVCVSIPQAVCTRCNKMSKYELNITILEVSIPQAVCTRCNFPADYLEIMKLAGVSIPQAVCTRCNNAKSG